MRDFVDFLLAGIALLVIIPIVGLCGLLMGWGMGYAFCKIVGLI